jgi:hypothetical protein
MINKKYFAVYITIFTILIFAVSLTAQAKKSIYSIFGVGQVTDNSFGINKSLGGTGIAFLSGREMNYLNPASYIGIPPNSFNMELGVYGIYNRSENGSTSQTDANINVSYFSASLYFTKWWASVFGLAPFSYVDYEINSSDEIGGELTTFEKKFTGTGGLSRVFLGNSFKVYKGLSVGFNASYIFGPITQTETASSNDNFTGYELKNERIAHSIYLDYGVQYSYRNNDWQYTIGLIYGADKKLKSTDNLEFTHNGITSSLEQGEQLDITIPEKFGIGFSVKKGNNFRAGLDYEWNNWSNINFSNPNIDTKNSNRFSIGVEYTPGQKEKSLKRLHYRLGANYKNSYLEIDNTQINSMAINFGLGIPFNEKDNVNISVEYGEEGTLSNGLIKNNYMVFYLNFSLHQFWTKRNF